MDLIYNVWPDSIKILLYSASGDSISPDTGTIIEIFFSVADSADVGDSILLHTRDCVLSDPFAQPIPCISLDNWFYFVITPTTPTLISPIDDLLITDSTTTFIWTSVLYASRYQLQVDKDSSFFSPVIDDSTVSDTFYTPTMLPDTIYYWRVRAGNRFEWSDWPSTWNFEINAKAPDIPTLISPDSGSAINDITPTFVWHKSSEATNYCIKIDIDTLLSTDTVYISSPLTEGLHKWCVKAGDDAGNWSPYSPVWTFIIDTTTPSPPILISPDSGSITNEQVQTLLWQSSEGATRYRLKIDSDTIEIEDTTYTTSPLSEGLHEWCVQSGDDANNWSDYSPTWTLTIDTTPPTVPAPISPDSGSLTNNLMVTFVWHTSYSATKYRLKIDTDTIEISDTTYTTTLLEGLHEWCVKSGDEAGNWSTYSPIWTVSIDTLAPVLEVNKGWGEPGSSDNAVNVKLDNSMGVGGVQFTLTFAGSLLTVDSAHITSRSSNMNLGYNTWQDSIKVLLYSVSNDSILPDTGSIIEIFFTVSTEVSVGDSTLLHLKDYIISDPLAHSIPCVAEDGWFYFVITPTPPDLISPEDGSYLSDNTPTFVFSTVNGASRYWLQVGDSNFVSLVINDSILTDSSYTPIAGLPDTTYFWKVRAGNRFEWSSWSSVWDFEIDTQVPDVPTLILPIGGVYLNDTSVGFQWSEVKFFSYTKDMVPITSPVSYILQVDTVIGFSNPVVETVATTYDTLNLNEWGYYYWRVKAYDLAGNQGDFSNPDSFGVDITPPLTVNLISPPDNAYLNDSTVSFIWNSASDNLSGIDHYALQYALDSSFTQGLVETTVVDTEFTSILSDTIYYWHVKAIDRAGNEGTFSSFWQFEVDTRAPNTPVLISPPDSAYLNDSTVNFIWNKAADNSGIDHYALQYALDSSFTQGLVETTVVDTEFTSILSDAIYYWHVKAIDKAGNEGTFSSFWQFEVDTRAPNTPILTSPVGGVWLGDANVTFQWSSVTFAYACNRKGILSSPVRYIIQVDTNTSFASPIIVDTLTGTSTTKVLNEDFYYWRVKAYDLAGNQGDFSNPDSFGVDITPPLTVTLISPPDNAYLNDSTVSFIWNSASDNLSGIDHYVLQYALDSSFTQGLVETTMVDTEFTTILSDAIYYWHVKAIDKAGNEGVFSSFWQFEVDTRAPNTPVLISPIGGIYERDTLVNFQWSTVKFVHYGNGASHGLLSSQVMYILQVDTTLGFTSPLIVDTTSINSDTVTLYENFPFYWRVKAYDLAGNQGDFSNPDSFGVDITPPIIDSTSVWTDTSYTGPFVIYTKVVDELSGVDSVFLYYKRSEDYIWVASVMHTVPHNPGWFRDTIPAVSNTNDTVRYYIIAIDNASNESRDPADAPSSCYLFVANYEGISENPGNMPFFILQNSNPFTGMTKIRYGIPEDVKVNISIYNLSGQKVVTLVNEDKKAGCYTITWDTKYLTSGVYFVRFQAGRFNQTKKLILMK